MVCTREVYVTFFALESKCAAPEKIHTHPLEGHWEFLGEGSLHQNTCRANLEQFQYFKATKSHTPLAQMASKY